MHDERKLARKTPLYDHAGEFLYGVGRDKARELIKRPDVDVIGTETRIKALRLRGPDPARQLLSGSRRRRPIGAPHQRENYFNPRGVWHIDRIPRELRAEFQVVVFNCLAKAA